MAWTDEEMLIAVRRYLSGPRLRSPWHFVRAEAADHAIRVFFNDEREGETTFAVDYPLADLPEGPNTGMEAHTPADWADEVELDIEEEVLTGGIRRAEQSPGLDGLVLLRWQRWTESGG